MKCIKAKGVEVVVYELLLKELADVLDQDVYPRFIWI